MDDRTSFLLRLPFWLLKEVKQKAKKKGISTNKFIILIISNYLREVSDNEDKDVPYSSSST